jgi:formylglycine-generating enzyme required for sulfatase activity
MVCNFNIRLRVGNGSNRVIRGGSWDNDDWNCRCAYRNWANHPANRDNDLGFRLVSSLLRQEPVVHG